MDASNFSKTQRKEYKAPTRKCRDCTYDLPLTSAVRWQSRERRRSQDKRTPAPERRTEERRTDAMRQEPRSAPQQSTTPTRIPCQRRLQQIRETRTEERCSDVQCTSGGWRREETGQQRTLGRREQLTPAQKKQIKRQKRMEEMAEIDQNPPPRRTTRPPRASAQKAQDEWRSDPRIRASGYADMHQQLHERKSSRARMLGAASRVGKENGHSKRPRPSFSDNTGYN
ncbi:hypothetical protein PC129_g11650 [Phytophthora cactorum]|uniref:Uncharacterized protein n=1 Tax=Phytophthora cactorum TaxID=29920 RepID=A0A329RNT8_9STRA|nr:hypothetical protein Pcac1_g11525 [Phytophthora cactorum]KAG2795973.1 hypothetical protein PC112_g22402 [Phytophthora cactorum]KAG2808514.1 hypothetical protein PC111_g16459 [Phytophthora cactorum]KAG2854186.1 hypothetical protein PC113_g13525 [Phytophthora cactorum]KAG2878574.1 hypothetical protein PC114_g23035 [Phytophthora cactorum]